nr:MAG TPA_asm: hypothetical protein [Caudoviricetes sp.]
MVEIAKKLPTAHHLPTQKIAHVIWWAIFMNLEY